MEGERGPQTIQRKVYIFLKRAMCNRLTDLEVEFMVAGGRVRGRDS